jgi:hypothetical protein
MARWTNWARTVSADVAPVRPETVEELQHIVAEAAGRGERVKAIGAGHSFTAIGETDGVQILPDGMSGILHADSSTGLVTVLAGTRLHELNDALWHVGLAMPNLGDIDVQTISGAISTGTHGTGRLLGGLATQVHSMQLVAADGSVLYLDADSDLLFAAARVGLGALGIIATITLRCVPAFALEASELPGSLDRTLDDLETEIELNDHFEFYWFPHTRRVLVKRNNRTLADAPLRPLGRFRHAVDDEFLSNDVFGAINRLTTRRPALIPRANALAARALSARTYTDRSYRVFTSPRRVVFREMEYASRAPPSRTSCARSRRGSRAATSGSGSRSRCASPPPTTSGSPRRTAATPATSPCTSTTSASTSPISGPSRRSRARWTAVRTGASCTTGTRCRCARPTRTSRTSSPSATSWTPTGSSATTTSRGSSAASGVCYPDEPLDALSVRPCVSCGS